MATIKKTLLTLGIKNKKWLKGKSVTCNILKVATIAPLTGIAQPTGRLNKEMLIFAPYRK